MKNVLIVDNNLGFVYWLGEVLARASYQPWPACSTEDAESVLRLRRASRLDLLVVNPAVRGAAQLVNRLRSQQPELKVLAVDPLNDRQVRGADAWRAKPDPADLSAKHKWLREVERVFAVQKHAA